MSKIVYSCLLAVLLLLGGCGGGSSSGGGESNGVTQSAGGQTQDGNGESSVPVEDIAGVYVGTVTATASGGGLTETVTEPVQIEISEDESVAFGEPGEPPVGTTSVSADGDAFSVTVPGSYFNEPGLQCTGNATVSGTISGDTITGDISSQNVVCNGIPITVTGDFNLTRTDAGTRARAPAGILKVLRSVVSDLAR